MSDAEQKEIRAVKAEEAYLRAILSTLARQAFPPDRLAELVAPRSGGKKQIAAYNLCDGEHTQSKIASIVGLDKANFNKSISRWIDLGILVRVTDGSEVRPVHLYPLPKELPVRKKGSRNGR